MFMFSGRMFSGDGRECRDGMVGEEIWMKGSRRFVVVGGSRPCWNSC